MGKSVSGSPELSLNNCGLRAGESDSILAWREQKSAVLFFIF
jgi:hypothetical protein